MTAYTEEVTSAAIPSAAEVSFGTIAAQYDRVSVWADTSALAGMFKSRVKWNLYVTLAGITTLAASFGPFNADAPPYCAGTIESIPGASYELKGQISYGPGSALPVKAGMSGYDSQVNTAPATTSVATHQLTHTDQLYATLASYHSKIQARLDFNGALHPASRWRLYALLGTGSIKALVKEFYITSPPEGGTIALDVRDAGAANYELYGASIEPTATGALLPTVDALLAGFDQNVNDAAGGIVPPGTIGQTFVTKSTGLAGWATASPVYNAVTLEQFGAVGNGIANDGAAMTAALAAIAGGGTILLGANKTYLVNSGYNVPANSAIIGQGPSSILKTVDNASLLNMAAAGASLKNLALQGSSAGASQVGVTVSVTAIEMVGVTAIEMGSTGFNLTGITPATYGPGPKLTLCVANLCPTGFYLDTGADYTALTACSANACDGPAVGVNGAQKVSIIGGQFTGSRFGMKFTAGAQVEVTATAVEGNSVTVSSNASKASFVQCRLVANAPIDLTSTTGVSFADCTIDASAYNFDGSQGTVFTACQYENAHANVVNNNLLGNPSATQWINPTLADGKVPTFIVAGASDVISSVGPRPVDVQGSTERLSLVGTGIAAPGGGTVTYSVPLKSNWLYRLEARINGTLIAGGGLSTSASIKAECAAANNNGTPHFPTTMVGALTNPGTQATAGTGNTEAVDAAFDPITAAWSLDTPTQAAILTVTNGSATSCNVKIFIDGWASTD